jgi:hypothetical protein
MDLVILLDFLLPDFDLDLDFLLDFDQDFLLDFDLNLDFLLKS